MMIRQGFAAILLFLGLGAAAAPAQDIASLPTRTAQVEALCERGHASACIARGDAGGPLVDRLPYFERACRLSSSRGCQRFFETASHVCENEQPEFQNCQNVGLAHQRGWGTPQDQALARQFYQRACDEANDRFACEQIAAGVPMPEPFAIDPASPAWKQIADWAWASVGSRLVFNEVMANTTIEQVLAAAQDYDPEAMVIMAMARDFGWEGPQNTTAAHYFYAQACEFGQLRGCSNLAYFEMNGLGTAQDQAQAIQRYERVCNDGGGLACNALGAYALESNRTGDGSNSPEETAHDLYLRACTLRSGNGCDNLGDMLWEGRGAVEANPAMAINAYRDGCNFLHPSACHQLGAGDTMGALNINPVTYYQRGCELGHQRSCDALEG